MKQNNITELVFILDRSGSMCGLEQDTIGGFNAMIEKQKLQEGTCYVTTILFDSKHDTIHDRLPLASVPPMTTKEYAVGGCTALLDAIGHAIKHIASIHRYARPEDVPARTLFVITTDGMENASHRFTANQIKSRIEHEKEKYGWEFLFLGANIDAVGTASRYGIAPERAATYRADGKGTQNIYNTVSETVTCFRTCSAIDANWSSAIRKDTEEER